MLVYIESKIKPR